MLGQRVITAAILLIVIAGALMVPSVWPFVVLLALATGAAGWEWLRLTLPGDRRASWALVGGLAMFVIAITLAFQWIGPLKHETSSGLTASLMLQVLVPLTSAIWIFAVIPMIVRGRADAPPGSALLSIFAFPALLTTWGALTLMFLGLGAKLVLTLLAVVWVADIAAYFVGRAIGKRKLAPRVSPGKTVEGALAGVLAVVIWIAATSFWPGSFGYELARVWTLFGALMIAALLGVLSIAGDLFESLLKRRAKIKDSSNLLPGHGGVFDRIDAILSVTPVALLFLTQGGFA
ncbi:phosphatidate cytidylyltransferase [Alcaligenaceae bacterium B3P038]|nr:phosphatidate cytidylyltransferase [Alcaligenaceae bacterium B3P038]